MTTEQEKMANFLINQVHPTCLRQPKAAQIGTKLMKETMTAQSLSNLQCYEKLQTEKS